jgi:hypothetical protein
VINAVQHWRHHELALLKPQPILTLVLLLMNCSALTVTAKLDESGRDWLSWG